MEYKINIYDKKNSKKIIRTVTATEFDLFYGTIETVAELLDIDNMKNNFDVLRVVLKAKDEAISILSEIFPDVTKEEWKRVKVQEMVSVLLSVLKSTVTGINLLADEKN